MDHIGPDKRLAAFTEQDADLLEEVLRAIFRLKVVHKEKIATLNVGAYEDHRVTKLFEGFQDMKRSFDRGCCDCSM